MKKISQHVRRVRLTKIVDAAAHDIRYAFRGLRAKPGFTGAVVLTLGLGIGANAAMFGIVDRLMFRAPAYLRDAARVNRVYVYHPTDGEAVVDNELPYTQYLQFSQWTRDFDRFAVFEQRALDVGTGDDSRERLVAIVSARYFSFFDASPALGRYFTPGEDVAPSGAPVVVLSHGYWQAHYAQSRAVLGETLQIDRTTFTIVGVAPEGFPGLTDVAPPSLFIPEIGREH